MRLDFGDLRDTRYELVDLCKLHLASLEAFRAPNGSWFALDSAEKRSFSAADPGPLAQVRHLSSSATCFESLRDLRSLDRDGVELEARCEEFAGSALARPTSKWVSDGAAHTYCRVRTLPLILETASQTLLTEHQGKIAGLVRSAWSTVGVENPNQGVREHKPSSGAGVAEYPPNAYLTYWALEVIEKLRGLADQQAVVSQLSRQKVPLALLWAEKALALQAALAMSRSRLTDAQQLFWAAATVLKFRRDEELRSQHIAGLLEGGLSAAFAQQGPDGSWERGEPLFHYPTAGNAYSYFYEALTELLRLAVAGSQAARLRELLRPHASELRLAVEHARSTSGTLQGGGVGWCSHHHPHRQEAESWATATTFSFLQQARRLFGLWTAEAAAVELAARTPKWPIADTALKALHERAKSWPIRGWTAGQLIGGLFLNSLASEAQVDFPDPDDPVIGSSRARSAILFGPPGTSKTTIVEALAGALGWKFVEVHASSFLKDGMDQVSGRADEIFQYVMELDHCVVLFDEIDELLRKREGPSDPFGRFLTTSMLPKLAKLWEQGRVLFFVNTNAIDAADAAIKRSQRFDASILVAPPSLAAKLSQLANQLSPDCQAATTVDAVEAALGDGSPLGWLALLRFDQIAELRGRLAKSNAQPGQLCESNDLGAVLETMGKNLMATDWETQAEGTPGDDDDLATRTKRVFDHFLHLWERQQFDRTRDVLLRVTGVAEVANYAAVRVVQADAQGTEAEVFVRMPPSDDAPPAAIQTLAGAMLDDGLLRFRTAPD